jgi:hypothetical protein
MAAHYHVTLGSKLDADLRRNASIADVPLGEVLRRALLLFSSLLCRCRRGGPVDRGGRQDPSRDSKRTHRMKLIDCMYSVNALNTEVYESRITTYLPMDPSRNCVFSDQFVEAYDPSGATRWVQLSIHLQYTSGLFQRTFKNALHYVTVNVVTMDDAYDFASQSLVDIRHVFTHEDDPDLIPEDVVVFFGPPEDVGVRASMGWADITCLYVDRRGFVAVRIKDTQGNP